MKKMNAGGSTIGYLTSSVDFIKVLSFLINLDLVGKIDKKISRFGDISRLISRLLD